MKRKLKVEEGSGDEADHEDSKRSRVSTPIEGMPSPRRRAFSRVCKFAPGVKVIGFYGGWPYVASVLSVRTIRMSFGATYMLLLRWNGFSGKKATNWISEFDVVKHDDAGLALRGDMENMQRELLSQIGSKVDVVKQRKVFLQVVQKFRGRKLAPFPPRFSPYPEEWQQAIRITAVPKTIIDYLKAREGSICEYDAVTLNLESKSSYEVLCDWAGDNIQRQKYIELIIGLLHAFLFKSLLYAVELHPMANHLMNCDPADATEVAKRCPIEYTVRLVTIIPQLVTAACHSILSKPADSIELTTLTEFIDNHQSFLAYLEEQLATLLKNPVVYPVDDFAEDIKTDSRSTDFQDGSEDAGRNDIKKFRGTKQSKKRKYRPPVQKFSRNIQTSSIEAS